jgi:ribosomal protein S18 acetylase RimI-like enzyme
MAPDEHANPALDTARAWRTAKLAAVCDVLERWAHGTVARATRYPDYYDFNLVRVAEDPGMSAGELVAFADEALAGLGHRKLEFDTASEGEGLHAELVAGGWQAMRLLWMRHERPAAARPSPAGAVELEEVPYDAVLDLRLEWHREDPGGTSEDEHERHVRTAGKEVALSHGARVLAVCEGGTPIAFAQLERVGDAAEVSQVYVHRERRSRGLGTAVTTAAIAAAGDVEGLWITADDADRAKHLYARLGFRPVWTSMEFLLVAPH